MSLVDTIEVSEVSGDGVHMHIHVSWDLVHLSRCYKFSFWCEARAWKARSVEFPTKRIGA